MKAELRGIVVLGAARLGWRGFAAVTGILAARHLGVELHGLYASALAAVTVLAPFADPGAGTVILREAAREGDGRRPVGRLVGGGLTLTAGLAALLFAATLLVAAALEVDPRLFAAVALLGGGMFLEALHAPILHLFQGQGRIGWMAAFQALGPGLVALAAIAVVRAGGGLEVFSTTRLAGGLLPLPFLLWLAARQVNLRWALPDLTWLLRQGLPYAATRVLSLAMTHAPTLVVATLVGTAEAGVYAAGQRPVGMLWVLPSVVSAVLAPRLFRSGARDPEDHQRVVAILRRALAALGIAIAGALFVASDALVVVLYGEPYRPAAEVVRGLAPFFALQCVNFPLGDLLTTADRHGQRLIGMGLGAATTVLGALALVPWLGPGGGYRAALLSELVMLVSFVGFGRTLGAARGLLRDLVVPALVVALALGASRVVCGALTPSSLDASLGALLVYGAIIVAGGAAALRFGLGRSGAARDQDPDLSSPANRP